MDTTNYGSSNQSTYNNYSWDSITGKKYEYPDDYTINTRILLNATQSNWKLLEYIRARCRKAKKMIDTAFLTYPTILYTPMFYTPYISNPITKFTGICTVMFFDSPPESPQTFSKKSSSSRSTNITLMKKQSKNARTINTFNPRVFGHCDIYADICKDETVQYTHMQVPIEIIITSNLLNENNLESSDIYEDPSFITFNPEENVETYIEEVDVPEDADSIVLKTKIRVTIKSKTIENTEILPKKEAIIEITLPPIPLVEATA